MNCDFQPVPTTAPCTPMGRSWLNTTAVVGYAGGTKSSPSGLACYHHWGDSSDGTLYESLGHAEAVQIELELGKEALQFKALVVDFFGSFTKTPSGMQRPDPGDRGGPYRSLIGIPGGVNSSLYQIVVDNNVNGMVLQEGTGDEGDVFNQVWIMDSTKFPFYRAEQYHQFHSNFFGPAYPSSYVYDAWNYKISLGHIPPTGKGYTATFMSHPNNHMH